ncbi:MAG TPA: Rieske (2Fe-2S) protein [Stellaceae bacterium]|nr:Rieske (2Fe-2S) protein [Stellaceae bacterium]
MTQFLCTLAELNEATPKQLRVGDRGIAVVRIGDEIYAIDALCPHWAGPLGEGEVSAARREITCPWHRFRFSLRDGRCVVATKRPPVACFPVRVEDGCVFAAIPAKER